LMARGISADGQHIISSRRCISPMSRHRKKRSTAPESPTVSVLAISAPPSRLGGSAGDGEYSGGGRGEGGGLGGLGGGGGGCGGSLGRFRKKAGPPHRAGAAALVAMEGEGEGAADWAREEAVTGVVVWAA